MCSHVPCLCYAKSHFPFLQAPCTFVLSCAQDEVEYYSESIDSVLDVQLLRQPSRVSANLYLTSVYAAIVLALQCVSSVCKRQPPQDFVFTHAYRCVQQRKATYILPNTIVT